MLGLGFGLNRGRRVGGFVGLLDQFPDAAAAYSLRKLRKAYTGAAVRVRESGGNTEADIGFLADGTLDTTALLAHCGANDGFVSVWYDQSGNGNDAVNTTLTEQPKIVSSSALVEENGKVAIDFDGVNDELNFSGDIPATEVSSIIVAKAITSTINNRFFGWRNSSFSFLSVLVQGASSTSLRSLSETDDGTQGLLYSGVDYTDNSLISMYNASVWRINGNEFTGEVSLGLTGVRTTNGLALGSRGDGDNNANVQFQEAIFYASDQSANRTGIESNINAYYNIY